LLLNLENPTKKLKILKNLKRRSEIKRMKRKKRKKNLPKKTKKRKDCLLMSFLGKFRSKLRKRRRNVWSLR